MALALGATPISVWATSPTLCVLTYEHLRQPLGHLRFIAAVALEDLRVELALAISRHLHILNPACGRDQVTRVIPIAISLTLGATLAPAYPDERVEFLAHHPL